jgi:hypothetical protein
MFSRIAPPPPIKFSGSIQKPQYFSLWKEKRDIQDELQEVTRGWIGRYVLESSHPREGAHHEMDEGEEAVGGSIGLSLSPSIGSGQDVVHDVLPFLALMYRDGIWHQQQQQYQKQQQRQQQQQYQYQNRQQQAPKQSQRQFTTSSLNQYNAPTTSPSSFEQRLFFLSKHLEVTHRV